MPRILLFFANITLLHRALHTVLNLLLTSSGEYETSLVYRFLADESCLFTCYKLYDKRKEMGVTMAVTMAVNRETQSSFFF